MTEIDFNATRVTMYTTGEPVTEKSENLRVWIEALRSGEYRQGESDLGNKKRTVIDPETGEDVDLGGWKKYHCCLGVACELSGEGHWTESEGLVSNASGEYFGADTLEWLGFQRPVADPSIEWSLEVQIMEPANQASVANRLGWLSTKPTRWVEGNWIGLETLNDGGFSFEEIADFIEQYPLRYIKS